MHNWQTQVPLILLNKKLINQATRLNSQHFLNVIHGTATKLIPVVFIYDTMKTFIVKFLVTLAGNYFPGPIIIALL